MKTIIASALICLGLTAPATAQTPEAEAKFISYNKDDGPSFRERSGLPQVGDAVETTTIGAKRIRARISDETLEAYVRASYIAVEVFARYEDAAANARNREAARLVALSANADLAEALEDAGDMDLAQFTALSDAMRRDAALKARARALVGE